MYYLYWLGAVSRKSRDFSGAFQMNLFVSSMWRRLEARIAVILIFIAFTTYEKTSFAE